MLVPLSDPIWTRLYGPYGVQDVAGQLGRLSTSWDKAVADDLFWERLHHQESLYPATYAALPWLRVIARQGSEARREVLLFLSWVAFCAIGHDRRSSERFAGLSLDLAAHQQSWLSQDAWLTEADMPVLKALEGWTEAELPAIAEDCIAEMEGEPNRAAATYLAVGPLAIWGGHGAARALDWFKDGEDIDVIREKVDLGNADFDVLHRLAAVLAGRHGWLRDFALLLDEREPRPEQDELPLW